MQSATDEQAFSRRIEAVCATLEEIKKSVEPLCCNKMEVKIFQLQDLWGIMCTCRLDAVIPRPTQGWLYQLLGWPTPNVSRVPLVIVKVYSLGIKVIVDEPRIEHTVAREMRSLGVELDVDDVIINF